ncbi:hypothetical protein BJ165DRAFT_1595237 [Panaeolus papilionaceus]|nr:hypothetical protein BJ165DRAFT_1595237 [Panaeolus papilionaceus]
MYGHFRPRFMYGGPRRIFWFAIGAVTASWYIQRKDERRVWEGCKRPALSPSDLPQSSQDGQTPWNSRTTEMTRMINKPSADSGPVTLPWDEKDFQQPKEHFTKVSRQAGEVVSELTENTLETVIAAAQAMREKLSDNRKREIGEGQPERNPTSSSESRNPPASRLV